MSNDFEDHLRGALRPIDPSDGFADRVMARIDTEVHALGNVAPLRAGRAKSAAKFAASRWVPLALAASAVFTVTIVHQVREQDERRGLEARRQLMEALYVTSEKLDSAYQAVNSLPAVDDPGV